MDLVDITSRIWRYGTGDDVVLGNMVFREDGRIGGYGHPNEAGWRMTEQGLELLDINATASRRFAHSDRRDGRWAGQAVETPHQFWIEPNDSHPIAVPYGEDILRAARRGKFYLAHLGRQDGVYAGGETIFLYPGAEIEPGATLPQGALFRIGAFSYVVGEVRNNLAVGRYCSIASGVSVFGAAHPTSWLSSSPMGYASHHQKFYADAGIALPPAMQEWEENHNHVTTHIGHDVWIGNSVLLKPGITIGNGAVIAARSIITRDVPAYAIVAGSPGRVLKYRFEPAVIEKLNRAEWWNQDLSGVELDWRDAEGAVDRLLALRDQGRLQALEFPKHDYAREILGNRVLSIPRPGE